MCSSVWWNHQLSSVLDSDEYMIMWDKAILTDLTVSANRPDIVFRDKRTLLIDVSCPCDSNVALKQTEKMTKYCLLKDEVQQMWNTSVVKKGQADIVPSLPGSCSIFEIQKTVSLGSMAILRKVMNIDKI